MAPRLECYGSKGTLIYDFFQDENILLAQPGEELQLIEVDEEACGGWDVEARFIEALHQNGKPEPTFETGVRYMEFIAAVHRSAATRNETCWKIR